MEGGCGGGMWRVCGGGLLINPNMAGLLLVNDHEGGAAAMNVKCSAGEPLTDLLVSALCVLTVLHGCRRLPN